MAATHSTLASFGDGQGADSSRKSGSCGWDWDLLCPERDLDPVQKGPSFVLKAQL